MKGNLIRNYSSNDKPENLPANRYFDKRWIKLAQNLSTDAGMHRFLWNLRYPRPEALHYEYSIAAVWTVGTPVEPMGPLVMPGKYKVVLTVNGKDYSKNLNVKLDPRVKVSESALRKQLELTQEVNTTLNKSVSLFNEIDKKLKIERDNSSQEGNNKLSELKSKVASLCGSLSGFASSVQAADASPTQGQTELFKNLSEKYKTLSKEFKNDESK